MNRFNPEWRNEWIVEENYSLRSMNTCCGDQKKTQSQIEKEIKFSVLVCTIMERGDDFLELWDHLEDLRNGLPDSLRKKVEIIAISDNRKMTIGAKRNLLLDHSVGDYVAFVDDDDWVSNNYLLSILLEIKKKPDCIGFFIKCENYPAPGQSKIASAGLIGEGWKEVGALFVRPPYHKTPVKASIAKKARFPNVSYAEDAQYARRIEPYIKTAEFINESLYIYNAPTTHDKNRYKQK